ncbi:hypothetical protein Bca52824_075044 [Brassica carinata]|uniref:Uncharacterized protein n=1 Tax=Brassica carinata TaxID=52824 RepID=A0A8X7TV18_BRACI|nr:hypothetical protein Bca52824_075044 [Brassica carinata]
MTESKITRRVLADLEAQIYTLTMIVQSMTVQPFPPINDVYVEVDDGESKEEDNLGIYDDDPVYDLYEDESEEDLCKEIYGPPIFDSYDDGDGDVPLKDDDEVFTVQIDETNVYCNNRILKAEEHVAVESVIYFQKSVSPIYDLLDEQSVAPIYDLYDDEIEQVTIDIVEDESLIFDCPIYDTEALTHSQKENSGKLVERLLFLKTWCNTKHSYISFNFCDVIVLIARQIDLKSAYNHYGEETRSYYETCEGLFASPVMQQKCDFDDKQFAVFVLLVEHVSIRSLERFCWGGLGENMFLLTPEDPMIVFASLHVLDCIGLQHLVLFSSRSAFHFDLDDPVLKPLLYLWLRIFSGIMTGNTYVVSTQQGWITEMFSSQVKPASLTAHFVLQATLSFFKSVVNVWDGTEVPTSCHHQLFVISKCANLCVKRGKYELYNSWDFFLSIVVSYTRPLVKLFEVKLVKVQKATHFLSLQGGRVSPFDLFDYDWDHNVELLQGD